MPLTTETCTMPRIASACAIALAVLSATGAAFATTPTPITHGATMTPAAQLAVKGAITMQAATLSAIHQVQYTDQGVETWIQVEGSGHCSYTIEGAVAPQSFASSAAKPFPMKVKILGAPLGSYLWTAKGTGNCTGTATTVFSVNG